MLVWPSQQFWKYFGNLGKVDRNLWKLIKNDLSSAYLYNKTNITRKFEDMNLEQLQNTPQLTPSLNLLVARSAVGYMY